MGATSSTSIHHGELYDQILKRMRPGDRNEARLLFQLIGFAIEALSTKQLKQAVALAKSNSRCVDMNDDAQAVEKFSNRLRAKSGGLLEAVDGKVRTIHKSVHSFLVDGGWFQGINIGGGDFASPEALWLALCCKEITRSWNSSHKGFEDRLYKVTQELDEDMLKFSFWAYSVRKVFDHARALEQNTSKEALNALNLIPATALDKLECISYLDGNVYYRAKTRLYDYIDWDTIIAWQEHQPWHRLVEIGLALSVLDALRTNKLRLSPECDDIVLALVADCNDEACLQIVLTLVEYGAPVNDDAILLALVRGALPIVKLLLAQRPHGKLKSRELPRHGGAIVGLPWKLLEATQSIHFNKHYDFGGMLDLLLERGECLNESCGPGGAMLHGIVLAASFYRYYESQHLTMLVERGAHVDICGPRGTPLQMAWRLVRYHDLDEWSFHELRQTMRDLKSYGANCNWIESDGTVVNEQQIDELAAMGSKQWQVECPKIFKRPTWHTWEVPIDEPSNRLDSAN